MAKFQLFPQPNISVGLKINKLDKNIDWSILDGALIGMHVQLCVFPLLQDPIELLRE